MRLLLVENYLPDAQRSMLRFGEMLASHLRDRGCKVDATRPSAVWRRRGSHRHTKLAKWLGYADKYIVFPRELRRRAAGVDMIHVLDHSNAVYLPRRARAPWVVTCHDLLAVRGAFGEDTDCPASALGRRLQRNVLAGLARADAVACDSGSTFDDYSRLAPRAGTQLRRVIPLGLHSAFRATGDADDQAELAALCGVPWTQPYLLHVGSNLRRKNKAAVVRVLARLREDWAGNVVFAGSGLTPELLREARAAGIERRLFAVPSLTDRQLEAAYRQAHTLIFPSKCEGFGWPVVEAQACGCPVICSDRTSLPEVAGDAGLVFALEDEAGMAAAVGRLADPGFRAGVVQRGLANVKRFSAERMIDDYICWYERVLAEPRRGS